MDIDGQPEDVYGPMVMFMIEICSLHAPLTFYSGIFHKSIITWIFLHYRIQPITTLLSSWKSFSQKSHTYFQTILYTTEETRFTSPVHSSIAGNCNNILSETNAGLYWNRMNFLCQIIFSVWFQDFQYSCKENYGWMGNQWKL